MLESLLNLVSEYWFWGSVGFIIGGTLAIRNMTKNGCSFTISVIAITFGIYGGLLGSRILYIIIFYPHLFHDNFLVALAFWQQSGTWMGAPLGGLLGTFILLNITKQPIWHNLCSVVPGIALAHAISRIGCLCAGCCYGAPTSVPWAIYSKSLDTMVHPTQIYIMISEIITFSILQILWKNKDFRKYLVPIYGILLSIHRFIIEFYRGDPPGPEIIYGLIVYQTICIFIFVISLSIIMILKSRKIGIIFAALLAFLTLFAIVKVRQVTDKTLLAARENTQLYLVITRFCFVDQLTDWKTELTKDGFTVVIKGWKTVPKAREIKDWIKIQTYRGFCSCYPA